MTCKMALTRSRSWKVGRTLNGKLVEYVYVWKRNLKMQFSSKGKKKVFNPALCDVFSVHVYGIFEYIYKEPKCDWSQVKDFHFPLHHFSRKNFSSFTLFLFSKHTKKYVHGIADFYNSMHGSSSSLEVIIRWSKKRKFCWRFQSWVCMWIFNLTFRHIW